MGLPLSLRSAIGHHVTVQHLTVSKGEKEGHPWEAGRN